MKQRILFVDDDQMTLNGLRRMLYPMEKDWEMDFVDRADKALKAMTKHPYDVVVADIRMPVMNGADFLNTIMEQYPQTIRLILSGFADQELTTKCVGTSHQYLAKPCDPEELKSTIHRTSNLREELGVEQMAAVIGEMQEIPEIPHLYLEIIRKQGDIKTSRSEITDLIRQDTGITAHVLETVNSPAFKFACTFHDIEEVVAVLGIELTKHLVLATELFLKYKETPVGANWEALWNHSIQTALFTKSILAFEGRPFQEQELAFTAGLLHDAGKLILFANYKDDYVELIDQQKESSTSLDHFEKKRFGISHAALAGHLLSHWGLPAPVVEAITLHHKPHKSIDSGLSLALALHVADTFAHEMTLISPWGTTRTADKTYLTELGLMTKMTVWQQAITKTEKTNSL